MPVRSGLYSSEECRVCLSDQVFTVVRSAECVCHIRSVLYSSAECACQTRFVLHSSAVCLSDQVCVV